MVNREHNCSGRPTDEQADGPNRVSSNRMRQGNQPNDILIKDEDLQIGSLGDQHDPLDDTTLDNERDAPRDSQGVAPGMSMAEKLGGVDPVPGAQRDPVSVSGERVSTPVLVMIGIVILVLGAAILAAVI
jgi:hypothetical protein